MTERLRVTGRGRERVVFTVLLRILSLFVEVVKLLTIPQIPDLCSLVKLRCKLSFLARQILKT